MNNRPAMKTFEDVNEFANKMRVAYREIAQQLNGRPDVAALHAEADALKTQYTSVPSEIRQLKKDKETLVSSTNDLRERYELIEANLNLACDGKNAEQRKMQLRIALAEDEQAVELAETISVNEFDIKMKDLEIEEKERIWSDYHRQVMILAAKANIQTF